MFEKTNYMLIEISGQQMERAKIQNDTAHKAMSNGRIILISTVIVAFIVVLIVMAALRKAILTPVDEIRIAAQALSQGATEQASSIEELSASIAESASQINVGVEQISSVVQTNSATSEESAAASEELSGQAELRKSLVGKFRLREMY